MERTAGNNLFVTSEPGEDNNLTVYDDGPDVRLQDSDADLDAGAGCVQVLPWDVKCPFAGLQGIYLLMQDGTNNVQTSAELGTYIEGFTATKNTFVAIQAGPTYMQGGPNHDQLSGSSAKDTIDGGGGPDVISGKGDDDVLLGGAGNDVLSPGSGSDTVEGHGDADRVTYLGRPNDVKVTLFDNAANDGELGEGDNVKSDVENVDGGDGDDTLTGTSGPNTLYGGEGHDSLFGGAGQDFLAGQEDGDNLFGQAGEDTGTGGEGGDLIDGGGDGDELYGARAPTRSRVAPARMTSTVAPVATASAAAPRTTSCTAGVRTTSWPATPVRTSCSAAPARTRSPTRASLLPCGWTWTGWASTMAPMARATPRARTSSE